VVLSTSIVYDYLCSSELIGQDTPLLISVQSQPKQDLVPILFKLENFLTEQ